MWLVEFAQIAMLIFPSVAIRPVVVMTARKCIVFSLGARQDLGILAPIVALIFLITPSTQNVALRAKKSARRQQSASIRLRSIV